eukprot:gene11900-15923_t
MNFFFGKWNNSPPAEKPKELNGTKIDPLKVGIKLSYVINLATENSIEFQNWTTDDVVKNFIKPFPSEQEKFITEFIENPNAYDTMLAKINLFNAEASVPEDRDAILALAKSDNDLHELIFTLLRNWIFDVAKQVLKNVDKESDSLNYHLLSYQLGVLYLNNGSYYNAALLLDNDTLLKIIHHYGVNHKYTYTAARNYSRLHVGLGNFGEAKAYLNDILFAANLIDKDSPASLTLKNSMGLIFAYENNFEDAKNQVKYCLETRRRLLGDDHPDTLESQFTLGYIYILKKKYFVASMELGPLMNKYSTLYGCCHPKYKTLLMHIATMLMGQKQLDAATNLYTGVYGDLKMLYGIKNYQVIFVLTNLCCILWGTAKYEKCETYMKQLIQVYSEVQTDLILKWTMKSNLTALYAVLLKHELVETGFDECFNFFSNNNSIFSHHNDFDALKRNMNLYYTMHHNNEKLQQYGLENYISDRITDNDDIMGDTDMNSSYYVAIFPPPQFYPYV